MELKPCPFDANAAEEYFADLAAYYKSTANDIFKRDNEGRHAAEQMYSAEYQKYVGMQIAMREVLDYFSKFELTSRVVATIPTADVVEVVRCADCKHYHLGTAYCDKHSYFVDSDGVSCSPAESPNWTMWDADDYCSDGERRDDHAK